MKQTLTILAILLGAVAPEVSAQVIKIYRNGALLTSYYNSTNDQYKVVFGEANPEDNMLTGVFTVGAGTDGTLGTTDGKKVQFTKSNLYWDGTSFRFEEYQTDYQTSWHENHVSHFFWTSLTDYKTGTSTYMPYAEKYGYNSRTSTDEFWCGEANPITVEGTDNLYALSSSEWDYLFKSRTNASSLYKCDVTVGTVTNCLIIAPDDFTGTLSNKYDSPEAVTSAGLVCLPLANYRDGSTFDKSGIGYYYSSTPRDANNAYGLQFTSSEIKYTSNTLGRAGGRSIRLVRTK